MAATLTCLGWSSPLSPLYRAIASDFSPSASNCSAQIRQASATGNFMPAGVFFANVLSSLAAADVPIRPSEWAAAWATWISESSFVSL